MTDLMQQLTLGNHHFAYRVAGSGPDVLLIHGWLSSGRMWEALMAYLAPQYRVWAPDLIGFGDSWADDPTRVLTVEDQTRLAVVFCKAVGIRPYAAIGHSMGGAIILKLALDYPELLDRLVLVCPVVSGKIGWNLDVLLTTPVGQTMLAFGQYVWGTVTQFSPMSFFVAPPYLTREVVQRTVEDFQKAAWGATYGGLNSLLNIRLDRRLHEIDKPTLIITGTHDLTVPPAEGRLAAALIRGARLIELTGCHHQVPDEEPERFHAAIAEFLAAAASQSAYAA